MFPIPFFIALQRDFLYNDSQFRFFDQQVAAMTFTQAISRITPPSPQAEQAARDRMARMGEDAWAALGRLGEYPPLLAGCTR